MQKYTTNTKVHQTRQKGSKKLLKFTKLYNTRRKTTKVDQTKPN